MPIYEYGCEKCGHEFEAEQRITDAPLKTCPECRGRRVRRLISRTSFVLKGGGWYSDLYASPGAKKADADSGDAAGTGSETPKDSKSETQKDAKPAAEGGASPKRKGKKSPKAAA